jgi:hypothetical protein
LKAVAGGGEVDRNTKRTVSQRTDEKIERRKSIETYF